ncbi:MAG: rhomboid family intramembrane serine protease [Kaistella sp.]|nr:rhomboid family intramembrane serine protease [Kaistella sp.]
MSLVLIIIIAATAIISFIAFSNHGLFEKYKFSVGAIIQKKEYIRLLSAGFLHADMMHLILNMYVLYAFSPAIFEIFGTIGFLVIYFGSILLGNLFSLYIYKERPWYSAIGASGGVSGVIFASVAMYPELIKIGIIFLPPELSVPGYIFGFLYFGYSVYMMLYPKDHDNVGHAAHLGGAFFGLIYAIGFHPQLAMENILFLGIMAIPLLYMSYMVFVKKKIG